MFYEQLKTACTQNSTSPTALAKELGLSTANTGRWKHGGTPSVEVLVKFAKRLGVTTDYLLGLTEIATPKGRVINTEIKQEDNVMKYSEATRRKAWEIYLNLSRILGKKDEYSYLKQFSPSFEKLQEIALVCGDEEDDFINMLENIERRISSQDMNLTGLQQDILEVLDRFDNKSDKYTFLSEVSALADRMLKEISARDAASH